MASSKKSSTATKGKEARTSKPAIKTKTKTQTQSNATKSDDNDDDEKKKKKISTDKLANNGSVKAEDGAGEDRAETTSKKPKTSKSEAPKRSHVKKQENGFADEDEDDAQEKICKFPMHRIKKIMRDENSDLRITQEALFLVNRASEMFLLQFCEDAYACCARDRKKCLAYKHLSSVVSKRKRYDFLSDFVPEKLKLEDALKERSMAEAEKEEQAS